MIYYRLYKSSSSSSSSHTDRMDFPYSPLTLSLYLSIHFFHPSLPADPPYYI